jgi:hypothetical protein
MRVDDAAGDVRWSLGGGRERARESAVGACGAVGGARHMLHAICHRHAF